jgi:citrate synthase
MKAGRDQGRLTTAEAAARLGVKPATLYAYVSRGLLARERSADGRTSTFDPAEIDRLARPGRARRGRHPSAELVVPSALTAIERGLPWYRGLAVPELAGTRSFEEVAEWLWTGRFPDPLPTWRASQPALDAGRRAQAALPPTALPLERIRVIAAALPAGDELRLELRPPAVTAAGRSLIAGLVDCLPRPAPPRPAGPGREEPEARPGRPGPGPGRGQPEDPGPGRSGLPRPAGSIAVRLWRGLSPLDPEPGLVGAVDAALVLLADHELAASTVAARVAASVRADPYAVASAGLAVVSGTLHGGASLGIEELLYEIDRADQAASVVGARLRRGERLRGFGHRLYPDGDPRAAALLTRLRDTAGASPRMEVVDSLLEAARRRSLPEPNVDLALAALAHVAAMTRGAGEAIFATARTAGWIAHALEEYDRNTPIRPRAVYTGPLPPAMTTGF